MFVLCISSDDVILRLSCVLYYSTVEKVESSPRAPRWTRQYGNDQIELTKTVQSSSRPSSRHSHRRPSRSRHTTPRTTRHHRTANRHATPPRTPPRTPPHRHAATTLRRHTQTATNTPPSDTPDGTNTKRATAATE